MKGSVMSEHEPSGRARRAAIRTAWLLAGLALAIYLLFFLAKGAD